MLTKEQSEKLYEGYPFIRLIRRQYIRDVRTGDLMSIMDTKPCRERADNKTWRRYYLIDEGNAIMGEVQASELVRTPFWKADKVVPGQTVQEAITQLGPAGRRLKYVVEVDHNDEITLYPVPKEPAS